MAIDLKQDLKLAQQIVVTPQLQQAIKLLQMSRLELAQLIQRELTENPVLEEEDSDVGPNIEEEETQKTTAEKAEEAKDQDKGHEHVTDEVITADRQLKEPPNFDWENYIGIYSAPERESTGIVPPEDLPTYENTLTRTESLHEHLLWQIHLSKYTPEEIEVATEIIGNINEDGYLTVSLEEIAEKVKKDVQIIENVLKKVQDLDPTGVGARNLKECLTLQAMKLGKDAEIITKIINDHLSDLEHQNYSNIAKKLKIDIEKAKEYAQTIHEMEPKPGRVYSQENPQYITPDVFVRKLGDEYVILLNEDGLPKLQISNFYRRTLMQGEDVPAPTREYIKDKIRSAMWLIKSIHQRQSTLYKVTKSIFKFQRDFLEKGVTHLKPMVLKEVAEDIGMHESTVSRVTANKYVHTPRGIFELKYFFNPSISQIEGGPIASEAVKTKIHKIIASEDPRKPLSDQEISEILKKDNINIARRTVAKYREMLKIPTSSRRRKVE